MSCEAWVQAKALSTERHQDYVAISCELVRQLESVKMRPLVIV